MDTRDDQPEILEYTSRKQVQPSHESANRLLLLYSIPSTALLLVLLGMSGLARWPRAIGVLPQDLAVLALFLAPLAFAFSLAAFSLGKQRGSGFALWYSMIVSTFAFAICFAATLLMMIWGVFSLADVVVPN